MPFRKTLGLTTHQAIESSTLRPRNSAQTFFGTRIHAPKKVCHNGLSPTVRHAVREMPEDIVR